MIISLDPYISGGGPLERNDRHRLAGKISVDGAPKKRIVSVFDRSTFTWVAAAISDDVTGEWEITGLNEFPARRLMVIASDTTGDYNAEIADYITQSFSKGYVPTQIQLAIVSLFFLSAFSSAFTLSKDALTATGVASSVWKNAVTNGIISNGKYYFEVKVVSSVSLNDQFIGVSKSSDIASYFGSTATSWGYYGNGGKSYSNSISKAYGQAYTTGDVVGVAVDLDSGKIFFSKNNVWQNSGNPISGENPAYTGLTGPVIPGISIYNNGSLKISMHEAYFSYSPPLGYSAMENSYLVDP